MRMRKSSLLRPRLYIGILFAALLLLGSCEAIFTYTPLKGLQRDPSSLSAEQRLTFAQDALASGDEDAMKEAYDAIKDDSGLDASYLTAELGIELSGLPDLIHSYLTDSSVLGSDTSIGDFIAAHPNLTPAYIIDAGLRLQTLDAGGYPIDDAERILGALGLVLEASKNTLPTPYDLSNDTVDITDALALLFPLIADDSIAADFYTYLSDRPGPP
jgi:hypothetical protein